MAIASCPKCATKLKVPDGTTASVRCPKCQTVFKTSAPAPAASAAAFEVVDEEPASPPKPAPRPAVAAARPAVPAAKPAPPPPPKEEPKKKVVARTEDDEDEDDRPRKKRRDDDEEDDDRPRGKKRSREDDEEDEDRPRKKRRDDDEEDDDDRPRGKKRSRDDEEDEDDRPRKKRKPARDDTDYSPPGKGSKFGVARVGVLLLLISLGLYAGSMGLQVLFILLALVGGVIPSGMGLMTGLLGLANWIVGLVGMGLCIGGPSRARGLAIAALSVAAVHLILAFITVNDSDSILSSNIAVPMLSGLNRASNIQDLSKELQKEEKKNPGSARAKELREELKAIGEDSRDDGAGFGIKTSRDKMRWADLTTQLPALDKLIAILAYESKAFSKCLLGIFSGMAELARIILISLLIGSLAVAARADGAVSRAKLGWIVAAGAGGAALLVMLLAFVIADNISKDIKSSVPSPPPPPNLAGKSFEEAQRANEEWQRQLEAEFEKMREKQDSAIRGPFRWLGIGEFLVLLLHVGSVAMPAMAALAVFSATKSGGGGGGGRSRSRSRGRGRDDDDEDD